LKRCSNKECCKQCGYVKFRGTMTKWPVQNLTQRTTEKHVQHHDTTEHVWRNVGYMYQKHTDKDWFYIFTSCCKSAWCSISLIILLQDVWIPTLSNQFSNRQSSCRLLQHDTCMYIINTGCIKTYKQNSTRKKQCTHTYVHTCTWYVSLPSLNSVNLLYSVWRQCTHTYLVCFSAVLEQCKLAVLGMKTIHAYIPGMCHRRPWAV